MTNILDSKDKQILMALDTDASQTYNQIGKVVRLSKEGVAYRVKQLERKGIIVNYITLSHLAKIGKIHFKLYIRYRQITAEQRRSVISYLLNEANIGWLASTEGTYDLMISIRYNNVFLFEQFKDAFCRKYDHYFQSIDFAILTEAETKPRAYILPKKTSSKLFLHCDYAEPIPMDQTDRIILNAISINARATYKHLENETGITARIIRYRRKQLEQSGIIVGYKLAINYRKLGYLFFKCFVTLSNVTEAKQKELRQYLRQHPNVIYWIKTIGKWDAELEFEVPSIQIFYEELQKLKDRFSSIIIRIDSTLVSEEHKIAHA